jgi:hypothetical protein
MHVAHLDGRGGQGEARKHGGNVLMPKIKPLIIFCVVGFATALAPAASAVSLEPPVPQGWLACEKDLDCTAVEVGCQFWQPVNKRFATSIQRRYSTGCKKSTPSGPQPPTNCAQHQCVNGPYTVHYWKVLGDQDYSSIQHRLISERIESCLQAANLEMTAKDRSSWAELYFQRTYQVILEKRLPDETFLDLVMVSVIPCEELVNWQRAQSKWERAQLNVPAAPRVRVDHVRKDYSFDDVYPPLIRYARDFQRCGQISTRDGYEFWGDMLAEFSMRPDGTVDPDSLNATYPATAHMRQFVDCASEAFKKLTFPAPADHRPVSVSVLIQVPMVETR